MITGTPKPIEEILEMVQGYKRVIVAGCFARSSAFSDCNNISGVSPTLG